MSENKMDIFRNETKYVFEFSENGKIDGYLITVCDKASGKRYSISQGAKKLIHWTFKDPLIFLKNRRRNVIGNRISQG